MWTNGTGFFYVGDMQAGDREATEVEIKAKMLQIELSQLSSDYKSDISSYQTSGYLAAIVADGPTEETKKAAFVQLIATRAAQYQADKATTRAKYLS